MVFEKRAKNAHFMTKKILKMTKNVPEMTHKKIGGIQVEIGVCRNSSDSDKLFSGLFSSELLLG